MIFRPVKAERLWDSWLFQWEGTMHLFYLASRDGKGRIGHATSGDLVHWERRADILPPHWPFTGMVVRHEGRFFLFLGEQLEDCQTTVLYASDDLDHWERVCKEPIAKPEAPHYRAADDPWGHSVAWRDPYVFWREEDQHYHMVICATAPESNASDTGARLGHARSTDLVNWEILPPFDAPTGTFYHVEVPEYFQLGEKHYLIFTTGSVHGIRLNTPRRRETVGTYYMVADNFEGPYRLPDDPLLLGAGFHRMASYVGRKIDFQGEALMYSQVREDSKEWNATWGAPKKIVQKDNGELELHYWPGLEKLETQGTVLTLADSPDITDSEVWSKEGSILTGNAPAIGRSCPLAGNLDDFHLSCKIKMSHGKRCGLILRSTQAHGIQISLDYELGRMEIGTGRFHPALGWGADITGFVPREKDRDQHYLHDACKVDWEYGHEYTLRILIRAEQLEVYLNNCWIFSSVFQEAPKSGDVEFCIEQAQAQCADFRLKPIAPLIGNKAPEI